MSDLPVISIIDTINFGRSEYEGSTAGPYLHGGKVYAAFINWGTFPLQRQIWMSADGGVTWNEQDHDPTAAGYGGMISADIPGSNAFYTVYSLNDGMHGRKFNTATNLWETGVLNSDLYDYMWGCQLDSMGVLWVCYRANDGHSKIVSFDGSVWGTPFDVTASNYSSFFRVWMFRIDPNDRFHLSTGTISPWTFDYFQSDNLGNLTTPTSIAFGNGGVGYPCFLGTQLIIPGTLPGLFLKLNDAWAVVDPYTSPTPSISVVDSGLVGTGGTHGVADSTNAYFFGIEGVHPLIADNLYYYTYNGSTFSGRTIFHDELAFPTPGGNASQFLHALNPPEILPGGFGVIFAYQYGGGNCTGLYGQNFLLASPPPPATMLFTPGTPVIPPPSPPPTGYPFPPSVSGPCRKTILHLWQPAKAPQVEITTDRRGDWTDCGTRLNKFFQGVLIDGDTFGAAKGLQFRDADTGALHLLESATITHSGRQGVPYSFTTPFLAHEVRDEPQDAVPWRKFGITYIWEPTPENVENWVTQWSAHGQKGYFHIARIETAYECSAPVTLTLLSFDGTSPAPVILPSTGGVYQKLLVTLTPNKGQLYKYSATSQARFRLFLNDWTVWLGGWGRTSEYVAFRNLGGEFGDKASI